MSIDHKQLLDEWTNKDRSRPAEYYACHIPDLCQRIEYLERVAMETEQLYIPIEEEGYGGGIRFNYVSERSVEKEFPRMFRLLLNKVRKDGERQGWERCKEYFTEHEVKPLINELSKTLDVLEVISNGQNSTDQIERESLMDIASRCARDVKIVLGKYQERSK